MVLRLLKADEYVKFLHFFWNMFSAPVKLLQKNMLRGQPSQIANAPNTGWGLRWLFLEWVFQQWMEAVSETKNVSNWYSLLF